MTLTKSAHRRSCGLLFPKAIANGRQSAQTFLSQNPTSSELQRRLIRQTRFLKTQQKQLSTQLNYKDKQLTSKHLCDRGKPIALDYEVNGSRN